MQKEKKRELFLKVRPKIRARKKKCLCFYFISLLVVKSWSTHQDGQHDVLEVIPQVGSVGAEENKVALHQLGEGEG